MAAAPNQHACYLSRKARAEWLIRQITEAFPWASAPAYLVRDNDRAYGHILTSRVKAMGIRNRPISPGSPWQNAYLERLIGTARRECLDRMLIFDESHLRQILSSYAAYYNQVRTRLAVGKDTPLGRVVQRSGVIVAIPILSALHHHYPLRSAMIWSPFCWDLLLVRRNATSASDREDAVDRLGGWTARARGASQPRCLAVLMVGACLDPAAVAPLSHDLAAYASQLSKAANHLAWP